MNNDDITTEELARLLGELITRMEEEYERTVEEDEAQEDELEPEEVEYNNGWASGMVNGLNHIREWRDVILSDEF
jgi:hypothetical protein